MIEIRWDLNREQQLYDQRKQLLLTCHLKIVKILLFFSRYRDRSKMTHLYFDNVLFQPSKMKTYVSLTGKCKLVSPIGFRFGTAIFKSEKLPIFQSSYDSDESRLIFLREVFSN